MTEPKPKQRRGFAAMNPQRAREIQSMGGKKAHELGTAHQFTWQEAKEAGRKGGGASRRIYLEHIKADAVQE